MNINARNSKNETNFWQVLWICERIRLNLSLVPTFLIDDFLVVSRLSSSWKHPPPLSWFILSWLAVDISINDAESEDVAREMMNVSFRSIYYNFMCFIVCIHLVISAFFVVCVPFSSVCFFRFALPSFLPSFLQVSGSVLRYVLSFLIHSVSPSLLTL